MSDNAEWELIHDKECIKCKKNYIQDGKHCKGKPPYVLLCNEREEIKEEGKNG